MDIQYVTKIVRCKITKSDSDTLYFYNNLLVEDIVQEVLLRLLKYDDINKSFINKAVEWTLIDLSKKPKYQTGLDDYVDKRSYDPFIEAERDLDFDKVGLDKNILFMLRSGHSQKYIHTTLEVPHKSYYTELKRFR